MINSVFGTDKNPFGKDVSKEGIFPSSAWKAALRRIETLFKYRGIGILTGEAGIGKSTLARIAVSSLNKKAFRIIYICDAMLSNIDFLRGIAHGLGINPPFFKGSIIRSIRNTLTDLNDTQRIHPILILDEVHLFTPGLLEQIRILTNFSMDSKDLFTTILIAQPHFLKKLALNINLSLKQRVSYFVKLHSLSREDTINYLSHRLKSAGIHHHVFSESAANAIYQASSGIPREINRIAFTGMNLAAEDGKNTVSDELIAQAIEEMELSYET